MPRYKVESIISKQTDLFNIYFIIYIYIYIFIYIGI